MRLLLAIAAAAAILAAPAEVGVYTAKFGDLGLDDNVVTNADFSDFLTAEEDPTVPSWAKQPNPPSIGEEVDPTVPAWAKSETPPLTEETGFNTFTNRGGVVYGPLKFYKASPVPGTDYCTEINSNGVSGWDYTPVPESGGGYWLNWTRKWTDFLTSESDPTVSSWAKASTKPSYTAAEVGAVPTTRKINGKALSSDITIDAGVTSVNTKTGAVTLAAADVGAYPDASGEQLSSQVSAIGSYLNAEDAHFVSTNYDSVVRMPEAYVEVRLTDNGTNVWTTIWQEMRRWNAFTGLDFDWSAWGGFHAFETNVIEELSYKADKAWAAYESETGTPSPEGFLQISTPNIIIAKDMAYQRTVTSDGEVWILQCNEGTAHIGGTTNGFFRITDAEGATQFEIIKGDKRTLGANASGITVGANNVMTIPYSVEAENHPTIWCCNDLKTLLWKDETDADCLCTVSWSGTSGAYVATVTPKTSQPRMFVRATYEIGGETRIRNVAPMDVSGGILCTDGIHKVRPVYNNGSVTWEVVQ